ncbi:MAG TPA: hypothetical protein VKK31_08505 [Thermoanaerobaculia bacterium]|nr:hypothetical protein [Thermoanaerobaculia bacterium]
MLRLLPFQSAGLVVTTYDYADRPATLLARRAGHAGPAAGTLGNGPWGARSWSYDKTGNRLTETRGAVTDTYTYLANATSGNTPQIDRIVPGAGPALLYSYDEAGNVLTNGTLPFAYGYDRRTSQTGTPASGTAYAYDGRGFLSRSTLTLPSALHTEDTLPTYSSAGLLLHQTA